MTESSFPLSSFDSRTLVSRCKTSYCWFSTLDSSNVLVPTSGPEYGGGSGPINRSFFFFTFDISTLIRRGRQNSSPNTSSCPDWIPTIRALKNFPASRSVSDNKPDELNAGFQCRIELVKSIAPLISHLSIIESPALYYPFQSDLSHV